MIGLVIVSHSARLAEGVLELVAEMGGLEIRVAAAGGLDLPDRPLGTDAALILSAINTVYSEDGVLVLMDLGSAILSAEMACDLLEPEQRARVHLCAAPLVEGAVVAAVQIRLGSPMEIVIAEARAALTAKLSHLGGESPTPSTAAPGAQTEVVTARLTLHNPHGLHLRPAARLVQTIGRFSTEVSLRNLNPNGASASGRSINALTTLGIRQGDSVEVRASGPDRHAVLAAIQDLIAANFGESEPETGVPAPTDSALTPGTHPHRLGGQPGAPGIGIGPARLRTRPRLTFSDQPAGSPEAEWASLMNAAEKVRADLTAAEGRISGAGRTATGIFAAHRLYLDDPALLEPARQLIYASNRSAASAWDASIKQMVSAYEAVPDAHLRARSTDVDDLGQRVLRYLPGVIAEIAPAAEPGVVIADTLTPSEIAALDPAGVLAIALAGGSPTGHSAILARARGMPMVVGAGLPLLALAEGTPVIVDGEAGLILVSPDEQTTADYVRRKAQQAHDRALALAEAKRPAVTRSGRRIAVAANIGSVSDARAAAAAGAEGVGVFRTEFLFLDRTVAPSEEEQTTVYRQAAAEVPGYPVVIRTLDAGGDKSLPYISQPKEANPFLGLRGLRLCLAQPDLFKTQLRAVLRAAMDNPSIRVLFPMVTHLEEVHAARRCLAEAAADVAHLTGKPAPSIEAGIMIEVPSAALLAEQFAPVVDFFSIGTNDLTQYTLAAERDNPQLAALADGLHPAVLRLIAQVVQAAHAHNKPVTVCGELAGDPVAVPVLLALGVDELSMNPASIPGIKRLIRNYDDNLTADRLAFLLGLDSAIAVRAASA